MKCHIGYGWADDSFDFADAENVDCLVCHEHTNAYVKGTFGLPTPETNLLAAARACGDAAARELPRLSTRTAAAVRAVKHGDLDSSLAHPLEEEDVHIGRHGFLCVVHTAKEHAIRGRAFSVSVEDSHGVACEDCRTRPEHQDARINAHLKDGRLPDLPHPHLRREGAHEASGTGARRATARARTIRTTTSRSRASSSTSRTPSPSTAGSTAPSAGTCWATRSTIPRSRRC